MTTEMLTQMRRGFLTYAILLIIKNAEPSVSINEMLHILSTTEFATSEGTLYPLLSRLAKQKLVIRGWEESDQLLGRKYYYLTPKGKITLAELDSYWKVIGDTLKRFKRQIHVRYFE